MSPTVPIVPSSDSAWAVLGWSLKYSNCVARRNQTVPVVPVGHGCMFSSRMCSSPKTGRPTVPLWASHSTVSQAVTPMPSVMP
jgi:hypothetical protein